ncbi:hypothetical protein N9W34_03365 [Rickettsiales bacterium]|nr:hypothetical protein [Rickettsiales bacterium]
MGGTVSSLARVAGAIGVRSGLAAGGNAALSAAASGRVFGQDPVVDENGVVVWEGEPTEIVGDFYTDEQRKADLEEQSKKDIEKYRSEYGRRESGEDDRPAQSSGRPVFGARA